MVRQEISVPAEGRSASKQVYRLSQTPLVIGKEMSVVRTSEDIGWTTANATQTVAYKNRRQVFYRAIPDLWLRLATTTFCGSIIQGRRQERFLVPADSISIIPPETALSLKREGDTSALHVFLRRQILSEVATELYGRDVGDNFCIRFLFGFEDLGLAWLLRSFEQALYEPGNQSALKVEYVARALAADVLRKYSALETRVSMPSGGRLSARQIKLITEYLHENLSADIQINDLAKVVGVSRTLLIRRFKASFGETPHQHIIDLRIRRAQELLEHTTLSMAQIASTCGFADQAHLSFAFRRATNMPPSIYRQSLTGC
jgi:AraC family transcriptional regulator